MVNTSQGVRYTKKLLLEHLETTAAVPAKEKADNTTQESGSSPNELHIRAIHTSKL